MVYDVLGVSFLRVNLSRNTYLLDLKLENVSSRFVTEIKRSLNYVVAIFAVHHFNERELAVGDRHTHDVV